MAGIREYTKAATQAVERYWSDWTFERTAKGHGKFVLRSGSTTRTLITSGTAGDMRAIKNFEADVRRAVRELREGKL